MPSKEYYRKLKKEAHDLYVREGMTCKEISTRINVSERSVSSWINENDALWKKERQASVISSQKQGDNLKQIINILADQKLELLRMIDEAIAKVTATRCSNYENRRLRLTTVWRNGETSSKRWTKRTGLRWLFTLML